MKVLSVKNQHAVAVSSFSPLSMIKGDGNPVDDYYIKYFNKPCILIPVSSKSVEKHKSCGHLNICKWTVMEAAIL